MATNGKNEMITLTFLHPRESTDFKAEVGSTTTAQDALQGLLQAGFIQPATEKQAYALTLQRTAKVLAPTVALATAGVVDGDTIAVTETAASARS